MSCSTVLVNNFTMAEDFDLDGEFSITGKMKNKLQKENMKESQNSNLRSTDDMSQTICLFKKYLTKAQNNIGRTNMEESQVIKKCNSDEDSSVPVSESDPRLHGKASFLEQRFLPLCNGAPSSLSEDRSSATGQLTIFYGGAINVYDNFPFDKAQAIMLLAGEISLSNTAANEIPEVDIQASHQSSVMPTSKMKTGPSMARRISLQRFLKKRHNRMVNKSPYASPIPKHNAEHITKKEDEYLDHQNHGVSLLPFPSHRGFNFPVSVDHGCM